MNANVKTVQECFWPDKERYGMSGTAEKLFGTRVRKAFNGRVIKTATTIFNAYIFNAKAEKVWSGSIDIEKDEEALLKLSAKLGCLYIFDAPAGKFMERIASQGSLRNRADVLVEEGRVLCSKAFAEKAGILRKQASGRDGKS